MTHMRPVGLGTLQRGAGRRPRRGRRRQAARIDHVYEAAQVPLRAGRPVNLPRPKRHPLRPGQHYSCTVATLPHSRFKSVQHNMRACPLTLTCSINSLWSSLRHPLPLSLPIA